MREGTRAVTLLTMALSGLVLAGCVDDSATTSPSGSASAPAASTPTASAGSGAAVASCVTGNWRSTAASAQAASGTASANLTGGSGVAVMVGPNGETVVDFSKMQPVDFTTKVAGSEVRGQFTFAGRVTATVRTGSAGASASATPGTDGTWEPVPPTNWGDTRVTVDLTSPVKVRPVDNVRISDYAGDGASRTGNVVDIEPLLGKGRYQCQGDTLMLTPDDGMSWTLTRA
jgi:hypothetical protein